MYARVVQSGDAFQHIERINQFLLSKIPRYNPLGQRELKEETELKLKLKDDQIQHLKDRLRIEQETSRSLRNQMKALKART